MWAVRAGARVHRDDGGGNKAGRDLRAGAAPHEGVTVNLQGRRAWFVWQVSRKWLDRKPSSSGSQPLTGPGKFLNAQMPGPTGMELESVRMGFWDSYCFCSQRTPRILRSASPHARHRLRTLHSVSRSSRRPHEMNAIIPTVGRKTSEAQRRSRTCPRLHRSQRSWDSRLAPKSHF